MALKKYMEFGSKKGEYLRILGLHSNTLYRATIVRMALYPDKETRDKDQDSHVRILQYVLQNPDLKIAEAYDLLKLKPELEGCEDI